MRVTQNTNFGTLKESIARSKGRMEKSQEQMSTMKKLNKPSDDPVGAAKVLEVRTDKVKNKQFSENSKLAQAFLNNTDHALGDISEVLVRAKEIAINQASGASSTADTRLGVAEEVGQLYQQAIALANTRIGDRYIFAGYRVSDRPVNENGEYVGDEGKIMVEIANDAYISMNLPGLEVFNTEPASAEDTMRLKGMSPEEFYSRQPASQESGSVAPQQKENINLFSELQRLRISLLTGDISGIRASLERFDQLHSSVVSQRAKIGARTSGLESSQNTMDRSNITNATLTSSIEDADMVEVMNDLAKEETVFKSVLSASQRLIQPTLMDFLK